MAHKYLLPETDGLKTRSSQIYAKNKLKLLKSYIYRFVVAMRNKNWRAINYIDLQAGPGKNVISDSGEIILGSPLIALHEDHLFTNYYFVELGTDEFTALETRISTSEFKDRVNLIHGDCNKEITQVVNAIEKIDKPYIEDKWANLNLAFLDPEGLELKWDTVQALAEMPRMDIIMNFSTSGLTRNVRQLIDKDQTQTIDDFFGTKEWQSVYEGVANRDNSQVRRSLIDFYKSRLLDLGYVHNKEHTREIVVKNKKNAQVYSLIFSSKHTLGIKFWNDAVNDLNPRLF